MSAIGLTLAGVVLLYEYGRTFEDGDDYVRSPPTKKSLAQIQHQIGCTLPARLIDFAMICPSYTSYFALLGEDTNQLGSRYEPHLLTLDHGQMIQLCAPRHDGNVAYCREAPEGRIYWVSHELVEDSTVVVAESFDEYLENFTIDLALGVSSACVSPRLRDNIYPARELFVSDLLDKYSK